MTPPTLEEVMAMKQAINDLAERVEQLEVILSMLIEEDETDPMEIAHQELVRGIQAQREGSG
jgi:hypothetical protein